MEHLIQEDSLERFAAGTASQDEARAITRHLLRECPICAGRLREILRLSAQGADYAPALDAFVRICLGRKEPEVPAVPAARAAAPRRKRPVPVAFH